MDNFIIGVVSSISATIVLFTFILIYKKLFLPYLQKKILEIPNISGSWDYYYNENCEGEKVGMVKIDQLGYKVSGKSHIWKRRTDGNKTNKHYKLSGELRSGKLICTYSNVEVKGLTVGALATKLDSNGKKMFGGVIYYSDSRNQVEYYPISLLKTD